MKVLTFTFLIVSLTLAGCKEKRRLSDDLSWMNNTYNPNDGNGGVGYGKTGWYSHTGSGETDKLVEGSSQTFASNGCKVTTWIEDDPTAATQEMRGETILKFDLHDIDPETIKVKTFSHYGGFDCAQYSAEEREAMHMSCDYAEMVAKTRNASAVIEDDIHTVFPNLSGAEHDTYNKSKVPEVYFEIGDVEYADHFAKTFRDAVVQCGGTRGAGN